MLKIKNKNSIVIGVLVIILGIAMLTYWGSQKEIWFCDEIYTYESANGFEQDWPADTQNVWMDNSEIVSFFAADSETLNFESISTRLYSDHVPLYFWLFRIVSFFLFEGSASIWIGLGINALFYLSFLLIIYHIFLTLTKNPYISGAVVLLSCVCNRLLMEQATMLRMYMMMLFAETLLLLLSLLIVTKVVQKEKTLLLFGSLFLVSTFGFLTHYHFWIFYACTAFICCLLLLFRAIRRSGKIFYKEKEWKYLLIWVSNFVISLLSTLYIFPYARWNLNRGKGQTALHSVIDFSSEKIAQILWGYERLSISILGEKLPPLLGLAIIFLILLMGCIILYQRKELEKLTCLIIVVLTSQAYQLIVCFTMPDVNEERYLWGSFTFMALAFALGIVLTLQCFLAKIFPQKIFAKVAFTAVFSFAILLCQWLIMDNGNGISYLFYADKDVDLLEEYKEVPWIVYGPTVGVYSYYDWIIPDKICFLAEEDSSERSQAIQKLTNQNTIILYVYQDLSVPAIELLEQELGTKITWEYLATSTNLTVYQLTIEH